MKLIILTLCVTYAFADVSHILAKRTDEQNAEIIKQGQDVGLEGNYNWSYETSNGISADAQGTLKNANSENEAQVSQGQASWTSPDGTVVNFQYIADENGYQVQGSHIPTPPPIPEAILRSLEYIRAHPPPPEKN